MPDLILWAAFAWFGWNMHDLFADGWRPWRHEVEWREVPIYVPRRRRPSNPEQH